MKTTARQGIRRRNGGNDRMGDVMQWLRANVLPKLRSWGKRFALGVQWALEKGAQGVDRVADPVLFVGFWFFAWLAYNTYSGMEALPKDEAARTLEWLKFYAYVVGGIVLIWQVRIANRRATALERTAALGEKGNITERFKNAIEHLGSDSESIRMGGIYGLYHVARESREYADTVLKIICVHVKSIMAASEYVKKEEPSNEIAAILDILFPIDFSDGEQDDRLFARVEISNWHLHGADFIYRNMRDVMGTRVNLSSANLWRARLSNVLFSMTDLSEADLSEADLSGADLSGADLSAANLSKANLSGANLEEANLEEANLSKADLSKANLDRADLSKANLDKADLSRANLGDADLSKTNLSTAIVTIGQLLEAHTLYKAQLSDHIREEILHCKPELLDLPADPDRFLPDDSVPF